MKKLIKLALISCFLFGVNLIFTQEVEDNSSLKINNSKFGSEVRGKNTFTAAGGSSVMNGDMVNPEFEIYFHAGYKRFLGSHLNINVTYHKFNLAYKDVFNEGFMSFDLNLEAVFMPFSDFSPYIYAGGGLNASNYFVRTDPKVQGGLGVEYLMIEQIGVKLFADYNMTFTDTIEGVAYGEADDIYWRLGMGLNFYFGKKLVDKKISKIPTVINSNPLVDDY
jgi:curli production assembly/transport component CsgG